MRARTAGVIESLLLLLIRALLPARGRRRAGLIQLPDMHPPLTTRPDPPHDAEAHIFWYDTPLVRPYLQEVEVFA
ncbi:hypothetical protein [Streptomyces roseochromogenus]|uniref:Uncharacterized protein n=1 Tax=Streptomyces roseochromogenus subsp. oscitans DS 12.976 TaxID=1352936 RepID=V6K7S2_STRRC|nr:hypothetical protein [Streptomyces roseochromogenus]EST28162.1 hypothetical protein M878_23235 [Streptomyces roseochromogenus subsp. oscitans DS 12.976]